MATQARTQQAPVPRRGPIAWITEPTLAGMARRRAAMGYLFILPTILGIVVFTAGPVIASFALSFFQWNVIDDPVWVGTRNYDTLIHDNRALTSFLTTGKFVLLAVTLQIFISLLLAIGVQATRSLALRYVLRAAFFLPLLTSAASISIVIAYMFHQDFGVINYYLGKLGIERIPWLNSPGWALITIVLTYDVAEPETDIYMYQLPCVEQPSELMPGDGDNRYLPDGWVRPFPDVAGHCAFREGDGRVRSCLRHQSRPILTPTPTGARALGGRGAALRGVGSIAPGTGGAGPPRRP